VYTRMRAADPNETKAYVLWEPYLSKALKIPGTHILLDSSNVKGIIVDVLVAERRFLNDKPHVVRSVVEEYFRALYGFEHSNTGMVGLLMDDGQRVGEPLTQDQAQTMVNGIQWKNTLENYAHFNITPAPGIQNLEDIVENITRILVQSGGLAQNPVALALMARTRLGAMPSRTMRPATEVARSSASRRLASGSPSARAWPTTVM